MSYLTNGTAKLVFRCATTPYVAQGQPERTLWWRCALFGKLAESMSEMLKKGTPVFVRGDFDQSTWTGNDGTPRTTLEVRVSEIQLLGSKPQAQPVAASGGQSQVNAYDQEGDVPF